MTNKEAIKLIQGIEEDGRNVTSEHVEALDLAIKALEADRWIPVSERLPDKEDYYYVWISDRWIPVSERLPDKEDYYYVWISDSNGNERPCSNWFDGEIFTLQGVFGYTVLAWKKMYQEPYKEREDSE